MKNVMSHYSQKLDILQKQTDRFSQDFNHITDIVKKSLFVLFVFFAFSTPGMAQVTAQNDGMDVSYLMKKDKKDVQKERQQLQAVREEKEQIKAVEAIPQITMDKFSRQFPKAENIEWSAPGGFIEADYTFKNSDRMAFYDWDNHLIGHGRYVDYSVLPQSAKNYIAKHYAGYTPVKTMWYDDNEDNDTDLEFWGVPFAQDSYITMMQKGDQKEALQITRDGEVSFFSNVQ